MSSDRNSSGMMDVVHESQTRMDDRRDNSYEGRPRGSLLRISFYYQGGNPRLSR